MQQFLRVKIPVFDIGAQVIAVIPAEQQIAGASAGFRAVTEIKSVLLRRRVVAHPQITVGIVKAFDQAWQI